MHSLPSGAPRGAQVFVLLVVCLQGLPSDSLGLSLVVQYDLASYSLRATTFPNPRGLVSSLTCPIVPVAIQSILQPIGSVQPLVWYLSVHQLGSGDSYDIGS